MTNELDVKDKKLLYELELNCRQSLNQLARKLRLSKNAVRYKIQALENKGIIKQFHTVINAGKLGLITFRLYINFIDTTPEKEEEIINFLKRKNIVTWLAVMEGKYNLGAIIVTRTISEMEDLWNELLEKYINYFSERLLTIITNAYWFSKAYLLEKKTNNYELLTTTSPCEIKLDEKDKEILRILADNSRISIVEISSKVKLVPRTVIHRIKNLEKKGIIIGYKAVIDTEILGYQNYKASFILLKVSKAQEENFRNFAKMHPNITYQEDVLGGDDFEIELQVKNNHELRSILDEIKNKFTSIIHDYKIYHIFQEYKNLYYPIKELGK